MYACDIHVSNISQTLTYCKLIITSHVWPQSVIPFRRHPLYSYLILIQLCFITHEVHGSKHWSLIVSFLLQEDRFLFCVVTSREHEAYVTVTSLWSIVLVTFLRMRCYIKFKFKFNSLFGHLGPSSALNKTKRNIQVRVQKKKSMNKYIWTMTQALQFVFTRYIHGESFRWFRQCQIVEYTNDFHVF